MAKWATPEEQLELSKQLRALVKNDFQYKVARGFEQQRLAGERVELADWKGIIRDFKRENKRKR